MNLRTVLLSGIILLSISIIFVAMFILSMLIPNPLSTDAKDNAFKLDEEQLINENLSDVPKQLQKEQLHSKSNDKQSNKTDIITTTSSSSNSLSKSENVDQQILNANPKEYIEVIVSHLTEDEEDNESYRNVISTVSKKRILVSDLDSLLNDSSIKYIETEKVVSFLDNTSMSTNITTNNSIESSISVCLPDTGINKSIIPVSESFIASDVSSQITNNHATLVAQTMLQSSNNINISFYDAKIADSSTGSSKSLIEATLWCVEKKPDIILFALALDEYSSILHNIVNEAYNDGILFVGATDSHENSLLAPASFEEVIGVGSLNQNNELSAFSPTNVSIELVDYGENTTATGTSFSSAKVAGDLVQLLYYFNETPQNLRYKLRCDAKDLGILGYDFNYGYGLSQVDLKSTNYSCNQTIGETFVDISKEKGGFKVLSALDGAQTVVLRGPACNQIKRSDKSYVGRYNNPDFYDCTNSKYCDSSDRDLAFFRFEADINLENVEILAAEVSIEFKIDSYSYADGYARLYAYKGTYNPDTFSYNRFDSASHKITTSSKVRASERTTVKSNDMEEVAEGFSNNYAYFYVRGETDGDDEVEGSLSCGNEGTYLTITYRECDPTDPCCTENFRFEEAGVVCKEVHDYSCSFANSNGCGGVGYEDRCDGVSSTCPDNNFEISYPGACSGTVCQASSCSDGVFEPQGICSANNCVVGTPIDCPAGTDCDTTTNMCSSSCSVDSDCSNGLECTNGFCSTSNAVAYFEYNNDQSVISNDKGTFEYDGFGQVKSFTSDSVHKYVYDESGQRIYVESNGVKEYYVDNAIYSNNGPPKFYYSVNSQKIALKKGDNTTYFQNDILGSTTFITDETGEIIDRVYYSSYGKPTKFKPPIIDVIGGIGLSSLSASSEEQAEAAVLSDYLYTGHEFDSESGLNYMNARYQDGEYGFMLQRDTIYPEIFDPQQLNLHAYGRNNPYSFTDPTGNYLSPLDFIDYASVGIGIYILITEPSWANAGWLGADVVGAAIPGIGGFSAAAKTIKAAKGLESAGSIAKVADKGFDSSFTYIKGTNGKPIGIHQVDAGLDFKKIDSAKDPPIEYERQLSKFLNKNGIQNTHSVNFKATKNHAKGEIDLFLDKSETIFEVKHGVMHHQPGKLNRKGIDVGKQKIENNAMQAKKYNDLRSEKGYKGNVFLVTSVPANNINPKLAEKAYENGYEGIFVIR